MRQCIVMWPVQVHVPYDNVCRVQTAGSLVPGVKCSFQWLPFWIDVYWPLDKSMVRLRSVSDILERFFPSKTLKAHKLTVCNGLELLNFIFSLCALIYRE
jgi:hypothetical protein